MIEAAIMGGVVIICVGLIFILLETNSNPNPNMRYGYSDGNNSAQFAEQYNRTETSAEVTGSYDWDSRSISGSVVFRRTTEIRQIANN